LTAHFLGSAEAAATDHVLYGWLFFSIVTLLLILIGLPFRETPPILVASKRPSYSRSIVKGASIAVTTVVLSAAAPRLLADNVDRRVGDQMNLAQLGIPVPAGCEQVPLPESLSVSSAKPQVDKVDSRAYRCGSDLFVLTLHTYPARVGARPVFTTLRSAVTEPGWDAMATRDIKIGTGAMEQHWSETEFTSAGRFAILASALWVDGRPAEGISGRFRQALNSFRSSPIPPVVGTVSYTTSDPSDHARLVMDRFLAGTESLSEIIGRISTIEAGSVTGTR
jgi:hypothetical protein